MKSSYAQIYKWTDADGTVHYSETKPLDNDKAKGMKVSDKSTDYVQLKYANSNIDRFEKDLSRKKESLLTYEANKFPITKAGYSSSYNSSRNSSYAKKINQQNEEISYLEKSLALLNNNKKYQKKYKAY